MGSRYGGCAALQSGNSARFAEGSSLFPCGAINQVDPHCEADQAHEEDHAALQPQRAPNVDVEGGIQQNTASMLSDLLVFLGMRVLGGSIILKWLILTPGHIAILFGTFLERPKM